MTLEIQSVLWSDEYHCMIRADIKSCYTSIDHKTLTRGVCKHITDRKVIEILRRIIEVPIDNRGYLSTPSKAIPVKSNLPPFLVAPHLNPLDGLLDSRTDLYYVRYNDNIKIPCVN